MPIIDEAYVEPNESFSVQLTDVTAGTTLLTPSLATVTITDNDTPGEPNPIDRSDFFVRMHYLDFFNRDPDAPGLAFWINNIESCGADTACREVKRIDTSAAFFLSIEFQQTGYLVYRTYKAAFGNVPGTPVPLRLSELRPDTLQIGRHVIVNAPGWEEALENNKVAYFNSFVARARFVSAYPQGMDAAAYVDTLFTNAGVTPTAAERQAAINAYGNGDMAGRAAALRSVAENSTLQQNEFSKAFVLMQYFGYLRRNPDGPPDIDLSGYSFWLSKLNQFGGDFRRAEMVKAFIVSGEYRDRFAH